MRREGSRWLLVPSCHMVPGGLNAERMLNAAGRHGNTAACSGVSLAAIAGRHAPPLKQITAQLKLPILRCSAYPKSLALVSSQLGLLTSVAAAAW